MDLDAILGWMGSLVETVQDNIEVFSFQLMRFLVIVPRDHRVCGIWCTPGGALGLTTIGVAEVRFDLRQEVTEKLWNDWHAATYYPTCHFSVSRVKVSNDCG